MAQNNVFDPYTGFGGNQQMNNVNQGFQYGQQNYYDRQNFQNFQNQGLNQNVNSNNVPRFFIGRPVESGDVLKTIEIPYDLNRYYFPKADGSEVYGKRWLPNGSTETITYVAQTEEDQKAEENKLITAISAIDERLDNLQNQISMLFQQNYYQQQPQQNFQQKRPNPNMNKKPNKNYIQDGGDEE